MGPRHGRAAAYQRVQGVPRAAAPGSATEILSKSTGDGRKMGLPPPPPVKKNEKFSEDTIEENIRTILKDNYQALPYWIQIQLQFLI